MSKIPVFQVDAFTDRPFAGNPAAVCLLDQEAEADWMQSVAAEMNLSETAFLVARDDGYQLRWFTPTIEVPLCGHATLASAHALWFEGRVPRGEPIRFHTLSGVLTAELNGPMIELDFPVSPVTETDPPAGLLEALEVDSTFVGHSDFDMFVAVESESVVRGMTPDFRKLAAVECRGVMVTSTSDDQAFDFVSRFFAPQSGIDEDPVTGSAHCTLEPYWGERLGKTSLTAFQASSRGGVVRMRLDKERVILGGQAVTVFRGELFLD
jgi:predicted PhzF superfamily epimerase YddE/YHI9